MRRPRRRSLATNPGTALIEECIQVPATPDSLARLHVLLADFWSAVDHQVANPPITEQRAHFATAIGEIGNNIIRYAYAGGPPGSLTLCLRAWPDRLEADFADRGRPYEPKPPRPLRVFDEVTLDDLPEGGFGLALARAALDVLDYHRTPAGDNHWTLISRLMPVTD